MLPACLAARPRCAVYFDFDNKTKHMYMQVCVVKRPDLASSYASKNIPESGGGSLSGFKNTCKMSLHSRGTCLADLAGDRGLVQNPTL